MQQSAITFEHLLNQRHDLTRQLAAVDSYIEVFYPNQFKALAKEKNTVSQTDQPTISATIVKEKGIFNLSKLTRPEMVKRAFVEIGQGRVVDVAMQLTKMYDDYIGNYGKALKDARIYTSALKASKQLIVIEEAKGNKGSTYKIA